MRIRRRLSHWLVYASVAAVTACGHNPAAPGDGTAIVFNLSSPEIVIGDTLQLTAKVNDATGNPIPNVTFAWTSLDPSIATVSADGSVTAVGMGETDIQVEATIPDSAQTMATPTWQERAFALLVAPVHAAASKKVRSKNKIWSIPKVVVAPPASTTIVKGKQAFTALIADINDKPITKPATIKWSSSNTSVATVDSTGLATGLANGSTTITASVTVGSAHAVPATARFTVADDCEGVASFASLSGQVSYTYERTGKHGTATIQSNFSATNLTATMTRDYSIADPGIAQWKGPLNGSATQSETKTYPEIAPYRLNDTGKPLSQSAMVVTVNLPKCTFSIEVVVTQPVTRTDYDPSEEAWGGVDIVKKEAPLGVRATPGSFFRNTAEVDDYAAVKDRGTTSDKDVFQISGFAQDIDGDLGNARVEVNVSTIGTNELPQALTRLTARQLVILRPTGLDVAKIARARRRFWLMS